MSYALLGLLYVLLFISALVCGIALYAIILDLYGRAKHYRNRIRTLVELRSMSDRELRDIGITRADISRVVRWG